MGDGSFKISKRFEVSERIRRGDGLSWRDDVRFGLGLPLLILAGVALSALAIGGVVRLVMGLLH